LHHCNKNHLHQQGTLYAIRNLLLRIPELKNFIVNKNIELILNAIDEKLFLTKALFFNKPAQSYWYVTWHQDITINVNEKIETPDFDNWTKKEHNFGTCPPVEILKNTVTVRLHLDETMEENGALHILPGSHNNKLDDDQIKLISKNSVPYICEIQSGGIQLMNPLLLHASPKIKNNKNRRVIHLEFNSVLLPNSLECAKRLNID
jgi:ectoine hydroxylase-related dioxygenase (phytanoyl-CoA dioxygenase family)